ncbi:polyprenyl synthetase family protein [Pseudovibrio sp. Tun.PSC04-5.I4]|uniref:polyprenyl synthetase family protein n=1 Tax=Pseudovibrio sp. Tun.PSC04-5.I4 TaxID=1798213 RepID=UPI00087FA24B|nr:farnesyl diphosphate synthase [Pseudovibrio sp. Tun.PSC04-5.I4]SDR27741.1 farnesyl diphosphate synthase [Pseudovibrio sp. Tun.PSC04-5.I4]
MSVALNLVITETAQSLEETLTALLGKTVLQEEVARPERLLEAMNYAALSGGKRLRPVLLVETARMFGHADNGTLVAASALECIHCYSLAHDDLPAMDDDDVRRGRPTTHKAFDEATAILAGDALLTIAFDFIADESVHPDAAIRLRLSQELARASGIGGMAGGQMLDLASEHRDRTEAEIRQLQAMKTGALIRYACRAGAILANASEDDIARLTRFGEIIGLAFQMADDLLDLTGDAEIVGKATGKDAEAGKATLVSLLGENQTRQELSRLINEADELLEPYGEKANTMKTLARYIADRES